MTLPPSKHPRAAVAVLAAGRGTRFGYGMAKQFRMLGGAPVFAHSLRAFAAMPAVAELALVLPPGGAPIDIWPHLKDLSLEVKLVQGGERRQDSVAQALDAFDSDFEIALIHDGARPFPPPAGVLRLLDAAMQCGGGLLAMPCSDTVKRTDDTGRVVETLDRRTIWLAQTPQAIRRDLLPRLIEAMRDPHRNVTDEASLLEALGCEVRLVEGSTQNFKITHRHDLELAGQLLAAIRNSQTAPGFD